MSNSENLVFEMFELNEEKLTHPILRVGEVSNLASLTQWTFTLFVAKMYSIPLYNLIPLSHLLILL